MSPCRTRSPGRPASGSVAMRRWSGTGSPRWRATPESTPVIVERAEGRELIDVDGNRYLDAISSLWVTTLGHGVPELDAGRRDQLGPGRAHARCWATATASTVELAEALAPLVPVDGPHFLFAGDGAAAVEQALKIAFQFWTNQGVTTRTKYLAFGGAYHGDTIGSLSVGAGGFGTDVFDPLRFPVRAGAGLRRPGCIDAACALVARHAHELAAVVRRAAGAGRSRDAAAPAARVRRARGRVCAARRPAHLRRGGHRVRPHRHAVRIRAVRAAPRPDDARQGHHRWLPGDGGHGRQRPGVPAVPRRGPRRADPVPRALLQRERTGRRGRARAPASCSTSGTCWPTSAHAPHR